MTQLDIHKAKDHFSELLDRARSGEEIMLFDGENPVVKLMPAQSSVISIAPVPEWKAALLQAAGMWKDRDDIPELMEQLHREWNRVEPPDEPL